MTKAGGYNMGKLVRIISDPAFCVYHRRKLVGGIVRDIITLRSMISPHSAMEMYAENMKHAIAALRGAKVELSRKEAGVPYYSVVIRELQRTDVLYDVQASSPEGAQAKALKGKGTYIQDDSFLGVVDREKVVSVKGPYQLGENQDEQANTKDK